MVLSVTTGLSLSNWGFVNYKPSWYLAIGTFAEDGGTGDPVLNSGAVYIFTRSSGTWNEQKILRASDAQASDIYGPGISLYGDTLAIGAYGEDGGTGDPAAESGAVYIYK